MKRVSNGWLCAAALAAMAAPMSAAATIDVSPKDAKVGAEVTSIKVVNNGNRTEYVSVTLSRLLNPGVPLEDEHLEPVGDAARPALYAYPFQMSLAPGQGKTIKLKVMRPVAKETVYRLEVRPVVKLLGSDRGHSSAAVVANLAFSNIVRQLPPTAREGLAVTCEASGARLNATGNVHYRVEGAEVDGRRLDEFNVYPDVPRVLAGATVMVPGHPACRGATRDR
ncbi:hypothetical protein [Burkholderia sp. 22PA0106]|uniref:hypothetical protein n=1 Tax=Burkholderia sp. 22PA0106 TaxID=3237371 RepID=UPI0039C4AB2F